MRGAIAKEKVIEKIKEAFGQDYLGIQDKKVYILADDGGEKVQIALSLTCPKVSLNIVKPATLNYNAGINFEDDSSEIVPPAQAEITDTERENIRKLMQRMGL